MKKIIVFILLLTMVLSGCTKAVEEEQLPVTEEKEVVENNEPTEDTVTEESDFAVGKPAPDFKLKNLQGEEVSLADYKGKIILLNFWATWCYWCGQERPQLQKFQEENDDVAILAVNVMETEDIVEAYLKENNLDLNVIYDFDGAVALDYYVLSYPTTYFLDEEGLLLGRVESMLTYDNLNLILNDLRTNR